MSYTRTYNETIVVKGSVSEFVTYPASKTGGVKRVTLDYEEHVPVDVHIHVDTVPFDQSVDTAKKEVKHLTRSVVATEAAQVASKMESSDQISNTIIDGFYGLIKSEIRQQILEIKPRVEALLMEMVHHQDAALAKKQQFHGDFLRIAERYTKIFHELDKELHNRVVRLNETAIGVQVSLGTCLARSVGEISPGVVTVHHKEGGHLHASLLSGGLKDRARYLLGRSGAYLDSEALLMKQFEHVLADKKMDGLAIHSVPVIYYEGIRPTAGQFRSCKFPEWHQGMQWKKDRMEGLLFNESLSWPTASPYHLRRLNDQMERVLDNAQRNKLVANEKVAAWIRKLMQRNAEIKSNK